MAKKTFKRLPNGFGSIVKLGGKRRNQWNARSPVLGYNSNVSPIVKSLGCFPTWTEAYDCLVEWHKKNDDPSKWANNITFAECYEKAFAEKVASGDIAKKSEASYSVPFKALSHLHARKLSSLKLDDLQGAIDGLTTGHSSKKQAITMLRLVFNYGVKHDYIEKDYSLYVKINEKQPETPPDKFLEWKDLEIVKQDAEAGDEIAKLIIIMCYSGFRASAYNEYRIEDGCFVGGVKNEQSRNRIVPVHPKIERWADAKFPYYEKLRKRFSKYAQTRLGRELTPHATRHTFKWLCDKAKVDENTCRLLMGHKLKGDVHNKVYTHREFGELREAISSLPW